MRAITDLFVIAVTIIAALVGLYFANETWWQRDSYQARYEAEKAISRRMSADQAVDVMRRIRENNIYICSTRGALPQEIKLPTLEAQLEDARERYRDLCQGSLDPQNRNRCNRVPVLERCTFNPRQLSPQEKVACHMNQGMVDNCVPYADARMNNACVRATQQWARNPRQDNPNINQSETNNADVHNIAWRRAEICLDVYGVSPIR